MDLKFPPKQIISFAAKDLINQVCFWGVFVLQLLSCSLLFLCSTFKRKYPSIICLSTPLAVKDSSQVLPLHKLLEHPWIVQNAEASGFIGASTLFSWLRIVITNKIDAF